MDKPPLVKVQRQDPALPLPRYESPGAAGVDLRARLAETLTIPPLGRAVIPTGLALEIPADYEAQVRPRSGLAASSGLTVLNSPGTIDSDYRGELKVILINLGAVPCSVKDGDRIAQLVFAPVVHAALEAADHLNETLRGGGGFGSTGR
jgi:dUTP pyrophosphatase